MAKKLLSKNLLQKCSSKALFLDNRGQAGAVFRLMIDAIIGMAILMIILSSISYFNDLRIKSSISEFNSLVESAVNAPDGKVIESGNLVFSKESPFSTQNLESITGEPSECFQFKSVLAMAVVSSTGYSIDVKQNIETKVYAQCFPQEVDDSGCGDASACKICCTISFGKKLAN